MCFIVLLKRKSSLALVVSSESFFEKEKLLVAKDYFFLELRIGSFDHRYVLLKGLVLCSLLRDLDVQVLCGDIESRLNDFGDFAVASLQTNREFLNFRFQPQRLFLVVDNRLLGLFREGLPVLQKEIH